MRRWGVALLAVATLAAWPSAAAAADIAVTIDGPAATRNPQQTFGFSSDDPAATYTCRLDTAAGASVDPQAACVSALGYTPPRALLDDDYVLTVDATDPVTNATGENRKPFTVDTVPPAAPALSGTPAGFAFSGEPGARFACRLDGPDGRGAEAACASPQAYPGLAPGAYTLFVHAIDAAGNAGPDAALAFTVAPPSPAPGATPTPTPLPVVAPLRPRRHVTVVARPGLADVRVRLPGSAAFVALTADRALPVGTLVDARRGSVQLIAAPRLQRATFDGAVFRVTQPGTQTVLTIARSECRPVGLTGEGRGAFAVRGRFSTTTVRSARWIVRDSCTGTLTRVLQGVAAVHDTARRRTLLVRAGRAYLARRGN